MTKDELQVTIGQNLRKIRLEQKLTIEQVAERVGISTTFYSNLESGNKMMSVETLRKMTDTLCTSADALLYGHDAENRIRSIDLLLRDQPPENIAFIEKLVRLCVNDLPQENKTEEGVACRDECRTE